METEFRPNTSDIADLDVATLRQHQFFRLVHRILKSSESAILPGADGPFSQELIRFRASTSMGFPASDIESLEYQDENTAIGMPPYTLLINSLGLVGPASPMPSHYTEMLLNDIDEQNTPRQFLDLFNHRFISYLYRVWDKYKNLNHYKPDVTDNFSRQILSLMGLGQIDFDKNSAVEWNRLLPLANILSGNRRSASSIEKVIRVYFDVPATIEEFIPENVQLALSQQTCLGMHACALGSQTVVGKSVLSSGTRFRLHIGSVDYSTYLRFLPGKQWHAALRQLLQVLIPDALNYDVWIKVSTDGVPSCQLSAQSPSRLGLTSWLGASTGKHITIKQQGVAT